jgi:hypothetical protein
VKFGAVRAVRRQSAPARLGRGSVEDLLSGDPHKDLDGKLLGTPEGQIDPRQGADWDIHEMLTETGTKPGIKLPAAPPLSVDRPFELATALPPPAPRRPPGPPQIPPGTVEYEQMARFDRLQEPSLSTDRDSAGPGAAAEDFEDTSTVAQSPLDENLPTTLPEKRLPATESEPAPAAPPARPRPDSSDLFDEGDEPTLLEQSPLRTAQDFSDSDEDATLAHQDPRRPLPAPATSLRRSKK